MKRDGSKKEIVSAMVRLNNQGLYVPLKAEDLKYPLIPGTATRVMKKKIKLIWGQDTMSLWVKTMSSIQSIKDQQAHKNIKVIKLLT